MLEAKKVRALGVGDAGVGALGPRRVCLPSGSGGSWAGREGSGCQGSGHPTSVGFSESHFLQLSLFIKFIGGTLVNGSRMFQMCTVTLDLYIAVCAHHPNSDHLPSPYTWPLYPFLQPPPPKGFSILHKTCWPTCVFLKN